MYEIFLSFVLMCAFIFALVVYGSNISIITNVPTSIIATVGAMLVLLLSYLLVHFRKNKAEDDDFLLIEDHIRKQKVNTIYEEIIGKHITALFKILDKDENIDSYLVALDGDYTRLYEVVYNDEGILISASMVRLFSNNIFSAKDLVTYSEESLCFQIKRYTLIDNVMI